MEQAKPNILVCGYASSGKSSLARAALGDVVLASTIAPHGSSGVMGYCCHENERCRILESQGLDAAGEAAFPEVTKRFLHACQGDPNESNHIHVVWYVLQGPGAKVTDCNINLIKNIFPSQNLVAVITKKDITRPAQLEALTKRLVEDAGLSPERIIVTSDAEAGSLGCEELVQLSHRMLPAAYKETFAGVQRIDNIKALDEKRSKAADIIAAGMATVAAIGAVPIPFSDAALLIPPQLGMIASLAALYGLSAEAAKAAVIPFITRLNGMFTASSLLKLIPGMGSTVNSTMARDLTEKLGWYAQRLFHDIALAKINGMSPPSLSFDIESFKEFQRDPDSQRAQEPYAVLKWRKPNILVCGKTGAGKSSLLQAVTKAGTVPDSAISHGDSCTVGFVVYETSAANFIDSEGLVPGQKTVPDYLAEIGDELHERLASGEASNMVHCVWYCLDGSGARLTPGDASIIRELGEHVLVLITKADIMRKEQMEPLLAALDGLLPREQVVMVSSHKENGLTQLMEKTRNIAAKGMEAADVATADFKRRWEEYYSAESDSWRKRADAEVESYIGWAAGRAFAIAIVPIPLVDVVPLVANETYMISRIGSAYGVAVDQKVITGFLGHLGASAAGKCVASFLPVLKAPIAASITYGVGKAAKAYFEADMKLDAEALKAAFNEAEREAKKRNWKAESE